MNIKLNGQIRLYDLKGMLIQEAELIKGIGVLSIDNITGGFYLIRVIDNKGFSLVKKVSIVH